MGTFPLGVFKGVESIFCRIAGAAKWGDYLTTSKEAHEELLRFLAEHRREYWTQTYLNIVRHQRGTRLSENRFSDASPRLRK
jgi:hypothetical protein